MEEATWALYSWVITVSVPQETESAADISDAEPWVQGSFQRGNRVKEANKVWCGMWRLATAETHQHS